MSNTNEYKNPPVQEQPQTPAGAATIDPAKLAEWESRARSDDPEQRGAGRYPSFGPPDRTVSVGELDDLLLLNGIEQCVVSETKDARVVRVIEDPGGEANRIKTGPTPAQWSGRQEASGEEDADDLWAVFYWFKERPRAVEKAFLAQAAFFGVTVIEFQEPHCRLLIFDVLLSPTASGSGRERVRRWVLRLYRKDRQPYIVQAQIPARLGFVVDRQWLRREAFAEFLPARSNANCASTVESPALDEVEP